MSAITQAQSPARVPASSNVTEIEDVVLKTDTRGPIRLGFWVLVVGFGLFLAWAAWAPLDEGVVAPSTVSIETRRKTIQHLQGGVVRRVAVKEGQEVRSGDVLVELDEATTRAQFEAVRQSYLAQRALESRLLAELSDAPAITFHHDLLGDGDAVAAQHVSVQRQAFASRRASLNAELAAGQQSVAGLEGQIVGLRQIIERRREQAALQTRQLAGVQSLAEEGFAPRNQALQLEQAQAELRASLAETETTIQRLQSGIAETKLRIAQRRQEYVKEVSSQLADVRAQVQANEERLAAITADLGRTQIRSPVDGQVVGLAVSGVGGVVTPGQRLMDIVPKGATLLLDAKLPPHVIDRVRAGDLAEVRFTGFVDMPNLVVHGKVLSLSGDAVTEQVGPSVMTYYLARVELTPEGMKALGNRSLQPGMPAEVLVRTGERSLLVYLLHPLTKRIAAAMTEE